VDVPALDAVIFFDTRDSIVDIVQSVGRVMRKAPGKKHGYIILPVAIPTDKVKDYNTYIESDGQFKGIWKVIKALRAHDERLVDEAEFRRRIKIRSGSKGGDDGRGQGGKQGDFDFEYPIVPVGRIEEAVYAAMPKKLGDREYWADLAKHVAKIAERVIDRIDDLIQRRDGGAAFRAYLKGLRKNINPSISEEEAIDMLAQHVITRPVFDALFEGHTFTRENPISQAMQRIVGVLDKHEVDSETEDLEKFYKDVRERVALAKSAKSKQDVIRNLYDTFFNTAFPRMAERLGIVYTPVEIVDFIVKSADDALRQEFGVGLADEHVHILDPFTGTGTFLVRLIQSGLIPPGRLPYKYANELHANELVLLAYYIAAVNIEAAYHELSGQEYTPFPGIVLTDTFLMGERKGQVEIEAFSQENSERAERQNRADIRVVIGNPPYSVGQNDANDNNQNQKYETLDASIRDTYAAHSTATNKNSLYDSYIRAFRWASNRIKDQGVICFVSNGGWIDGNTMDGFRKSLAKEFTSVYVFNLRGNARTQGELRRKEAGNVFDAGSRTPIAITLLVKNPAKVGQCEIYYRDIGDYLSREEKLAIISEMESVANVPWERITPNENHDWINQRSEDFDTFIPLNDDPKAIFSMRSRGVETSRDDWVYNYSKTRLEANMRGMIDFYNAQVALYGSICHAAGGNAENKAQELIDTDSRKIKWTRGLIKELCRNHVSKFDAEKIGIGVYRPFSKSWIYYDRVMNEYFKEKLYPSAHHQNLAISVTGLGVSKDFSCLMVDALPDVQLFANGQCFPLYHYEKAQASSGHNAGLFDEPADPNADADGYTRKDAITDTALADYRAHYQDDKIGKEDIFYYVYGILHSPEYRERYANDLKKMLPRIPFAPDFWAFSKAGRELAYWHLNYEQVDPYEGLEIVIKDSAKSLPPFDLYRVEKMAFASLGGREKDRSTIEYNSYITIKGIPLEAYDYVVNGKSAIEWIMDRYRVTVDMDSGIKNDPNDWCREHDDPAYIFNLVQRVVRVSVETVRLVHLLPSLELIDD
jgi:predicted helicase